MINTLIEYFEQHIELSDDEKLYLSKNIEVRKVPKNEMLLSEGKISKEFFFIFDGSIRLFYNKEGIEKTAFFYTEEMFVSSYESFTKQIPAKHSFQTIEDSIVAVFTFETAYDLLEKHPRFEFLARIMMEEELIIYQDILASFITLSAEERYIKLIESNSDFVQRVPQHQIATFLGVSPETLSRIRKRIASK